jgi:hypothetical protein
MSASPPGRSAVSLARSASGGEPYFALEMEGRLWRSVRSFPEATSVVSVLVKGRWGTFSLAADLGVCEDEKLSHRSAGTAQEARRPGGRRVDGKDPP